jgi:hypothetical protein
MAQFSGGPAGWNVQLSHDEVTTASDTADLVSMGVPPPYDTFLSAGAEYLRTIDALGGHNGVNVSGSGPTFVATPAGVPIVGDLINVIVKIGAGVSTEAVDIVKGALGLLGVHFGSSRGELHADEDNPGSEETFAFVSLPNGKVAILAYTGYFCADHDREGRVWADRQGIGPWENWGLVHNGDGSVSFSSDQGWYISANPQTNHCELWTNRQNIGQWESFNLAQRPNGFIALQARSNGKWVSAAPG